MLLGELIARLDTEWSTYVPSDDLARECGIHDYIDGNLIDHGFSMRPVTEWCCTDTWVGLYVIYYNGEPVATSNQTARKSDVEIEWFSKEAAHKVRDALLALVRAEEPEDNFKIVNLNEEIGEPSYQLNFSSQVIHDDAIYQGRPVKIVKTFQGYDSKTWHLVVIRDGENDITVNLKDVHFPVKLLPKTD